MEKETVHEVLHRIWYSSNSPAGYGSQKLLFNAAKKKLKGLTREQVSDWLKTQDVYTLFQGRNRPIITRKYFSPGAFSMLEADLVFLPGETSNFGHVGALAVIDVFSRFAFVKPIKKKSASTIASKLQEIFDDPRLIKKIQSLRTDRGKEFDNSIVGDLCQQRGILQFFANPRNKTKCALIERFNRTFKEKMVKMRQQRNSTEKGRVRKRWVDLVEPVLALYNLSPHTSLDNHSPTFASRPDNWRDIFEIQQNRFNKVKRKHRKDYYRRGTLVRIRLKGGSFGLRASDKKNSDEVFRVRQVHSTRPVTYSLRDSEGNPLEDRFYHQQLVEIHRNQ